MKQLAKPKVWAPCLESRVTGVSPSLLRFTVKAPDACLIPWPAQTFNYHTADGLPTRCLTHRMHRFRSYPFQTSNTNKIWSSAWEVCFQLDTVFALWPIPPSHSSLSLPKTRTKVPSHPAPPHLGPLHPASLHWTGWTVGWWWEFTFPC